MNTTSQIIGWIGTFLVVLAYILISYKKVDGSNRYYQLLNLFGAIAIGINVFYQQAWPALVLQIVWGVIAIIYLVKNK